MRKRGKGGPKLGGLRNPFISASFLFEIRMGLHTAYSTLASQPTPECVEQLREIVGAMRIALSTPARRAQHTSDLEFLNHAATTLRDLHHALPRKCDNWQLLPVLNAVQLLDRLFEVIGVTELHVGLKAYRAIEMQAARAR